MSALRSAYNAYMTPFRTLSDGLHDRNLTMTAKVIPPVAAASFAALSLGAMAAYFIVGPVMAGVFFWAGAAGAALNFAVWSVGCAGLDKMNNASTRKHVTTRTNRAGQTVTGTSFDLECLTTLEERLARTAAAEPKFESLTSRFAEHAARVTIESAPPELGTTGHSHYIALGKNRQQIAAQPARTAAG